MGCNCKWTEIIIALVILIVTILPNLIGAAASRWVTLIAAVVLLIHALMCKKCGAYNSGMAEKSAPMKKTRRKRR